MVASCGATTRPSLQFGIGQGFPAATRKLEMVSNEELAEADCIVVGRSYDIARDQAPVRAFKLLGYSRATDAIKIGSTEW